MRATILNLLLLLAGGTLALALGEAAARGLGLSKTWSSYRAAPLFISAERTTGRLIGYHRLPGRSWDGPFGKTIATNSRGFREEEPPGEPPSDEVRVGWLGDSVTEGYGLAREERFSDRVELALSRELGRPVRSMNFAVAGHSAVDYVAILGRHILPARPHAVVIQTNAGDALDALGKREPFLEGRWDEPLQERSADPGPACSPAETLRAPFPGGAPRCAPRELLRRHSALYLALAERWNLFRLRRGDARAELPGLAAVPEEAVTFFHRTLARAAAACDSAGVPLLVVYSPLEAEVQLGDPEASMAARAPFVQLSGDAEGIRILDLTPLLREHAREALYLDNIHLTSRGNELVAEALTPVLARMIRGGGEP